ncbi:M48 family metalloprotease [Saccharothrix variisporea]|uniref:Zn-dependent protease with chaperone function n=1 Tax=Saccharothrix variisporea TaxID=543527 RepID=A0A495XBR5_9PSEU|nr:M48 family metallopeptidase [Saccharothrix variisporea]RKT71079.1 Zn-dependent protease with chaperone function [Saccharothrix variisporea]
MARSILAVAMLVGFFVLVLGLTVGLGAVAVIAMTTGHFGVGAIKVAVIAGGIALAVAGAVYKALKQRAEPEGVPLTRAEQPELWRVVDELAVIAGTRAPDDIRLVPEVNAAVWEKAGLLGLRPGPRYLMIGLPLLAGLTVGELRSVLAHELGHYGGGHTKLSALTYRAKNALAHTVDNLGDTMLQRPLAAYARLYARVAASVNRRQELDADAASVAAAGRATAQSALRKILSLDAAWDAYHEDYVSLAPAAERTPQVLAGFRSFLGDPRRSAELVRVADKLLDEQPASVFDSHPPIRERIAVMEALPSPDVPTAEAPAWSLVTGLSELERGMIRDDLGPVADWPEIVQRAGAAHVAHFAGLLVEAGKQSGFAPAGTLDELLTGLEQGRLGVLAPHVLSDSVPPQERDRALVEVVTQLLGAVLLDELVRSGRASFRLDWGGPWRVVLADGTTVDAPEVVAPAVQDPTNVSQVRERVSALCDRALTR